MNKLFKIIKYNNDIKALKELLNEGQNADEIKDKIKDLEDKIKELIKD